jgi:hypothetical protein
MAAAHAARAVQNHRPVRVEKPCRCIFGRGNVELFVPLIAMPETSLDY